MERNKELVLSDFIGMIKESWTYAKMTYEERIKLLDVLDSNRIKEVLKGTYDNRWRVLQAVHYSYLIGIGYSDFSWREDK